jgi:serine/threonine protein kinase/Tol biopolymer transport system component
MSPERYQQACNLYHAALEIEPQARSAFLDGACGEDHELRSELESLLEAHDKAGNYFAAPAMEVAADLLAGHRGLSLVGRSLSHYRVLSLIGAGGMGEVYLAEDTSLGRKVALKLLPAAFTGNPDRVRRFEQEAKAASALNDPNILTIHEIGDIDNCHFIVSEYVEGETLRRRINDGKMECCAALDVAAQVASALAAAHAAGITHRDIKPENVMMRPDGLIKVLDFGLAKLTETQSPTDSQSPTLARLSTDARLVMGTISYMSPEQARGLKVDHRTDIFSLGVMLYEMVSGRHPFEGETTSDIIAAILQNDPPPVGLSVESPLPEIDTVINRMIEKDRAARYQSSTELRTELRGLQRKLDETSAARQVSGEAKQEATADTGRETRSATGKTAATTGAVNRSARWLPLAMVVALLAFGVFGLWFVKWRGAARATQAVEGPLVVKTTQLTSWRGLDFCPALARDGKTIAFSSDRSGSFEIYVKQLVPGARENSITSDGGQNYQPAFSSDGSLIAYHSKKRGGIWVIPLTGGAPKQLTEFGSNPAWSPNDSLIAFQSEPFHIIGYLTMNPRPPSTLWVISTKGGEPRQLTPAGAPPGGHGGPSWSPDGERIVFNGSGLGERVWSISAQGDDLKEISGPITGAADAVYAPDGKSNFFTAETGWSLYKVNLAESGDPIGGPVVVSTVSGQHIRKLSIAANGKGIVYCALSTMSNIWAVPLAPKTNVATGEPIKLTQTSNKCDLAPAFSPDGKTIAYWTFATGVPGQIWTMDANGTNHRQITTGSGAFPWWFPDGNRVALSAIPAPAFGQSTSKAERKRNSLSLMNTQAWRVSRQTASALHSVQDKAAHPISGSFLSKAVNASR